MKSPLKRHTRAGFSLIEMIVVVGIIAVIATFA
ncbi:MAG: prepilin-type N-terminal cleavage/methylation domain-containing protein, partial [Verrucomicrobiaceae bacterium]